MRLTKQDRQRIVDGYLAETGADGFRARDFLEWLEPQTNHAAWQHFFGRDDVDLARERREQMARQFVSDLRIKVRYSQPVESGLMSIRVVEVPAFVSPLNGRANLGGYVRVDGAAGLALLRAEGVNALRAWLSRYRGAFEADGLAIAGIEAFVAQCDAPSDDGFCYSERAAAAGGAL